MRTWDVNRARSLTADGIPPSHRCACSYAPPIAAKVAGAARVDSDAYSRRETTDVLHRYTSSNVVALLIHARSCYASVHVDNWLHRVAVANERVWAARWRVKRA